MRCDNSIITLTNTDDLPTGKRFKARFITAGLAGYPDQFGTVLIKKESLDKFVDTLVGRPVVIRHQEVTNDNIKKVDVGRVANVWFDEKDGWYWCDGIITDDKALNLINSGWSVSCSYNVTLLDDKGGMENNIPYDMEFLDGVFTHLALVDNPRYERAMVVLNSKTERKDNISDVFFEALAEVIVENGLGECVNEKWITMHPHKDSEDYRRLKLEDGETPKEAMKRQWGVDIDKKEKKQQKDTKSKKADEYKKRIETQKAIIDKSMKSYHDISEDLDKWEDKLRGIIGENTDTEKINEIIERFKKDNPEVVELNKKLNEAYENYNKTEQDFEKLTEEISAEILKSDTEDLSQDELEDLKEAIEFTKSFGVYYETREKLNNFEKQIKQKIDSINYNNSKKELKEIAGVKRGKPMTFDEADNGRVNPNYQQGVKNAYSENCQSCVVCYELRRRGFDVKTKPRVKTGWMQKLAQYAELAYLDPQTGKHPETQKMNVGSPDKAYEWLDKNVSEGRYEFRVVWKSIYKGHIITAYKENNNLVLYDPQTNKKYTNKEEMKDNILNDVRYKGKEITKPFILRVDNLDMNSVILDDIVEKV